MPSKFYRPRIRNTEKIDWERLLALVAILEDTTKAEIIVEAIASYSICKLDDHYLDNPNTFQKVIKEELEKLKRCYE